MKNYTSNILIIYLIFSTISCNSQDKEIEEASKQYRKDIVKFGDAFVNHFPKNLNTLDFTTLVSENITESHPKVWLKHKASLDYIDSVIAVLSSKSMAIYEAEDSCLLIIDKHLTKENWINFDKTSKYLPDVYGNERECSKYKLPVPKIWEEYFVEDKTAALGLSRGYKLYILDAQKGEFLPSDSLPNGKLTPTGWEHGFSKGVAINRQSRTLIYWFDIW